MNYSSEDIINFLSKDHGEILVFNEIDSTNNYIKEHADSLPDRSVVCALRQISGRGRRGHSFFSPDGGVYFSVYIRTDGQCENVAAITSCAAVCISDSILALTGLSPRIKWVNDILIDNKKICGILCEALASPEGRIYGIICGVGINLFCPPGGFPDEISNIAAAISDLAAPPDPAQMIADIVDRIFSFAPAFDTSRFIGSYIDRSLVIGKNIDIISSEGTNTAFVESIRDDASLLVRYPDGSEAIVNSGEISIKIQEKQNG